MLLGTGIGGVLAVVGLFLLGQVAGLASAPLPPVVAHEDFSAGAGAFETAAGDGFRAVPDAGALMLRSVDIGFTDWVTMPIPTSTVVDVTAQVTLVEATTDADAVGLVVLSGDTGYLYCVSAELGAEVYRITPDGGLQPFAQYKASPVDGELRFAVEPGDGGVWLTAFANGEMLLDVLDPQGAGAYDAIGVALYTEQGPAVMRVDDVVVRADSAG